MTDKNRPNADEEKNALDSQQPGKRPYRRPEFRLEKVFETMALACGKIAPTMQSCRGTRRRSSYPAAHV
jgi:hypothetical protein